MHPTLPTAAQVIALHDRLLASAGWPATETAPPDAALWHWVQTNHRFNCRLWAEEDLARRTTVGDSQIAANKRAIDGFNQARNDATERVDELLLVTLGLVDAASARTDAPLSSVPAGARLNSETAGTLAQLEKRADPLAPAPDAPALEHLRHRTATAAGRALYALRQQTVEPVFGIIKEVRGFRRFSLRGLAKVAHEWDQVCQAYNLKRPYTLGARLRSA